MIRHQLVKRWRDSATLILAARNNCRGDYSILMLKRSSKSGFMPNLYVFPGGVISTSDYSKEWEDVLQVNPDIRKYLPYASAPKPHLYVSNSGNPGLTPEVAFKLCALRETFEECGILLVKDSSGVGNTLFDPEGYVGGEYDTLGKWREKVNEDASNFLKLFRTLNCSPDVSCMYDWSTWLTPNFSINAKRFDALFYICFLEKLPNLNLDGGEVVDALWRSPVEIMNKSEIKLAPPQVYELLRLSRYSSINELENFAKEREKKGLSLYCPHKINLSDGFIFAHSGDDYHNDDPNEQFPSMELTIAELLAKSSNVNRVEFNSTGECNVRSNVEWCGHPPLGNILNVTKF